jgi:pimeloyl-ACP methyl ester carboxylesterase
VAHGHLGASRAASLNLLARPPVVLVHGAANSAGVWIYWQSALSELGWTSHAIDLRGHGAGSPADLSATRMTDYADDVRALVRRLPQPTVLVGWSMGGLVAMMAAAGGRVSACVGLAPSLPASARNASVPLRAGTFGPEEYGIMSRDADTQPMMPDLDHDERRVALATLGLESRLARDERAAGVVIERLPCPLLVVTGGDDRQWPRSRYAAMSLPSDWMDAPGASHWGLVLSRRALAGLVPRVASWIEEAIRR